MNLADRFGHTRVVDTGLVLTVSPGGALGQCVARLGDGTPVCTDGDGDGVPAANIGCAPAIPDCDDADPLVSPLYPEIPGDGLDNDCGNDGDTSIEALLASGVTVRPSIPSLA